MRQSVREVSPHETHFVLDVPHGLHVVLVELKRRDGANTLVLLRLVHVVPLELGRRNAKTNPYDLVDLRHHLEDGFLKLLVTGSLVARGPQNLGVLSQFALQNSVETPGGVTREALWEALLRHEAVLGHEVDRHVPLAAVVDGVAEDVGHSPSRHLLASLGRQN